MTSEETRNYLGQRMQELGLQLRVDDAGYEKIQRFTNGKESGINQLCFKLMSQLADDDAREIDTERVNKAIDELAQIEHMMRQAANTDMRRANDEQDLTSIEQLAAVLEANSATVAAHAAPAVAPALHPRPVNGRRRVEKPKKASAAARPKVLVVNDASTSRATVVDALKAEFDCIVADDAEDAWRRLVHQTNISIVITDVQPADRCSYDLIGRMRSAAVPAHLIGLPIIAVTGTEDAAAKQQALMAGANDVIAVSAGAGELLARVRARYKATRLDAQYGLTAAKPARPFADRARGPTERPAPPRPVIPARPAAEPTLDPTRLQTLRRPFAPGVGVPLAPAARTGLLARLYDISSTATVTLTATALLALLLVGIVFIDRTTDEPAGAGAKIATAPTHEGAGATPNDDPPAPGTSTPAPEPPTSALSLPPAPATPSVAPSPSAKELEQPPANNIARLIEPAPPPTTRPKPTESSPPAPARSGGAGVPAPAPASTHRPGDKAALKAKESSSAPAPNAPIDDARGNGAATAAPLPAAGSETDTTVARSAPERTVPPDRLTKDDLSALLKRFAFVYEAGDLEQFISLFAPNARTNDRANRDGIRQDYESLFRSTDLRQFKLSHVNWEVDNNQAHGWGNFEVTVKRAGDQEPHNYLGSLTLYVEKVDGRPRIVRLYHGQRRAQQ